MMNLSVHTSADEANSAAANLLAVWLTLPGVENVMLAAGNTPLDLYRQIGERRLTLGSVKVFALDEYVGVPRDEPRNCANLIRRTAIEPWGISEDQYFPVSSVESEAAASIQKHEQKIEATGGLDVIVLGLGQNGHLGFNEPGSAEDSRARVLDLDRISIEANRKWFGGDYAPARGVTVGMRTILSARRVLIMAYGAHKARAVQAMIEGPRTAGCPASFLQGHPHVHLFLDKESAALLSRKEEAMSVIGIDVGGTKIAGGLLRLPNGEKLAHRVILTEASRGGRAVLEDVLSMARDLCAESQNSMGSVSAIGVGICELVTRNGAVASANCIEWTDLPLIEELDRIAPALIEADVRAAALAEARLGAGKPFRSFLYVTIGTGVSCCLMQDGVPYQGASGAAGTMASSPLAIPCEQCGQIGSRSLEQIAAGPALVARFQKAGGRANTGQEVLLAAESGDLAAAEIVRTATEALGSQVGLLINVLDPEGVVFGGGLGLREGTFWESLVSATRRHIWSPGHRHLPIHRAALGTEAGWIGAALCAAEAHVPQGDIRVAL